jgi:hypothetical protein
MILQALHADKRLKELGKQGRIIIKTFDTDAPLPEHCTSQENQRLPGLKQLSQFPDFQMNRQCNTDFQGALMGYFD